METESSFSGFAAHFGSDWVVGIWGSISPLDVIPPNHLASLPSEYTPDLDINVLD